MKPIDLTGRLKKAIELAEAAQVEVAEEIAALKLKAFERGADGKLTGRAKSARQALTSPALTSTLPSVAVRDTLKPSLARAIERIAQLEEEYLAALASASVLEAKIKLFEGEIRPKRKREVVEDRVEPEEMAFLKEMRAREVPISAMDQFNSYELDGIAGMFIDKQQDPRHRHRTGLWWALISSGAMQIPSEAWNEEERAAILAVTGMERPATKLAYDVVCDAAGRQLDIPRQMAEFILMHARFKGESPLWGFERNLKLVEQQQLESDLNRIYEILDIDEKEFERALRLMDTPKINEYKMLFDYAGEYSQRSFEERERTWEALRPAAILALKEAHDAERSQEYEMLGANALGVYNTAEALERLTAHRDEDVLLGMQVWHIKFKVARGEFHRHREEERRSQVHRLVDALATDSEVRKNVEAMGVELPDLTKLTWLDGALVVSNLDKVPAAGRRETRLLPGGRDDDGSSRLDDGPSLKATSSMMDAEYPVSAAAQPEPAAAGLRKGDDLFDAEVGTIGSQSAVIADESKVQDIGTVSDPIESLQSPSLNGTPTLDLAAGGSNGINPMPVPDQRPSVGDLDAMSAKALAETMYDGDAFMRSLCWTGTGLPENTYEPDKLVPALERAIALGTGCSDSPKFLQAAREGRAREFIAGGRQLVIEVWARRLLQGEEKITQRARRAGLLK